MDTATADTPPSPVWTLIVDPNAHSVTHDFFTADGASDKDDRLVSPAQNLTPFGQVTFWHRYLLEDGYDGGVLEVSTDGGTDWAGILTAGGKFVSGAYNSVIDTGYGSPIGGESAWSGGNPNQTAMTQVVVDLGLIRGSTVKFRWREVCDSSGGGGPQLGWFVDDVSITSPGSTTCPPVAVADTVCTLQDIRAEIHVLANDTDPENDSLKIVALDTATAQAGTAALNNNGTASDFTDDFIDYTPAAGFLGNDNFSYTITDGHGNLASGLVTVNVALGCGLSYYSLTPCRILDTRVAGQGPALVSDTVRVLTLAPGACAVPSDCQALSINLTIVNPTGTGDLILYPAPGTAPKASTISFAAGKARANNSVVWLDGGGATQALLRITGGGSADLIVDENGCFR